MCWAAWEACQRKSRWADGNKVMGKWGGMGNGYPSIWRVIAEKADSTEFLTSTDGTKNQRMGSTRRKVWAPALERRAVLCPPQEKRWAVSGLLSHEFPSVDWQIFRVGRDLHRSSETICSLHLQEWHGPGEWWRNHTGHHRGGVERGLPFLTKQWPYLTTLPECIIFTGHGYCL